MKNTKFLKIVGALLVGLFIISFSGKAEAATLTILPQASQVSVGDKISLDVKIDSSGDSINAVQSSVRFPKDIINVESIDKTNSVFNFWLEDPNFSNSDGIISFIGGTAHGISGASLHIIKINFVAKSVGIANITLQDSAITSSDGSGTNVLSKTNDGVVSVVAEKVVPEAPIAPKQIVREPVFAGKLPEKPNIRIPLYPDSTKWYNLIGSFNAIWDLPLDISGISTAVNHQPSFIPAAKSEGLFDDKSFHRGERSGGIPRYSSKKSAISPKSGAAVAAPKALLAGLSIRTTITNAGSLTGPNPAKVPMLSPSTYTPPRATCAVPVFPPR